MKQVFIDEIGHTGSRVVLNEEQAHHLFDVLRIQKKEVVRVVDNHSQVFLAHPEDRPYLYLFNEIEVLSRLQHVTLCAALIKGDRWEWMLQKACELGVTRIVPFTSRFTVVHIDETKEKRKLERWTAICRNACEQCNRSDLPAIEPIQTVETLRNFQGVMNLVAYEKESEHHLAEFLAQDPESITFCIGPEGGFAPEEIDLLKNDHFQTCSLGNQILRAETAVCYVLSAIEYQRHIKGEN
ncbi:RsmE family RNA methyltransferase [Catenisphaera adipataccumulans]|uniref:Ribosomal RNA small subunit methyltransferase E n=1 Tax=Catenisphaera adipataccumulans TaxID=700500 RepID=A0A7W8CXP5_9FIRM|nr:RsmE family RNA methyltransferase [Catenisphaera adipataccumulans]MBB5183286.1 16S rRNA (uracil1498-N3)-methyltransferase [Catenisphaera adipataccumulans]